MNNKKIVFIDCDNTLVTVSDKGVQYIPESAEKAIIKARENGVLVYLCTGRSLGEMNSPVSDMEFDGIIGGSGAFILEGKQMVYHKTMDKEDVEKIIDSLKSIKALYMLESNSGIYATKEMKAFYYDDPMTRFFGEIMKPIEDADYDDVNKIVYMSMDLSVDALSSSLDNRYDVVGLSYGDCSYGGEISTKGVSKGTAVQNVLERLNIDYKNTYSVGDSHNDVEMFKNTCTSVAMGNSIEGLEEYTTYKSSDIGEDGLYNAFVLCGLIEKVL